MQIQEDENLIFISSQPRTISEKNIFEMEPIKEINLKSLKIERKKIAQ